MSTPTNGSKVYLYYGTKREYDGVVNKNNNTIYFITDTQQVFVGDSEYTRYVQLLTSESDPITVPPNSFALYVDDVTAPTITKLYFYDGENTVPIATGGGGGSVPVGEEGDYGITEDTIAKIGDSIPQVHIEIAEDGTIATVDGFNLTLGSSITSNAGTFGLGADATPSFGDSFKIPVIVVSGTGDKAVTSIGEHILTLPNLSVTGFLPVDNPSYTGVITGESNSVSARTTEIIGSNNTVVGANNALSNVVGNQNKITVELLYSEILGSSNTATSARHSIVSGDNNFASTLNYSHILGYSNNATDVKLDESGDRGVSIHGNGNIMLGSQSTTSEIVSSSIVGHQNTVSATGTISEVTIHGSLNKVEDTVGNSGSMGQVQIFGDSNTANAINNSINDVTILGNIDKVTDASKVVVVGSSSHIIGDISTATILGNSNTISSPNSASGAFVVGSSNTAVINGGGVGNTILGSVNTFNGDSNSGVSITGYGHNVSATSQVGLSVFGYGQQVTASYSWSVSNVLGGNYNTVSFSGFANNNIIFGRYNEITASNTNFNGNMVFGDSNIVGSDSTVTTNYNLVLGENNTVASGDKGSSIWRTALKSTVLGSNNSIIGDFIQSVLLGSNNTVDNGGLNNSFVFANNLNARYSGVSKSVIFDTGSDATSGFASGGSPIQNAVILGKNNHYGMSGGISSAFILGDSNSFDGGTFSSSYIIGDSNNFMFGVANNSTIIGSENSLSANAQNVKIVGIGNSVSSSNKTVFGDYSVATTADDRFIFGMGSTSANANALTIGKDSVSNDYYIKLGATKLTEPTLIDIINGGGGSTSKSAYISHASTDLAYITDGTSSGSLTECNIVVKSNGGVNSATIIQHGKNFCNPANFEVGSISENQSVGADYSAMKTAYLNRGRVIELIQVLPTMKISWNSNYALGLAQFDKNGEYLGSTSFVAWITLSPYSLTLFDEAEYIAIIFKRTDEQDITNADFEAINIQLEVGSTATTFEAYHEDTYTVTFPVSAGSVNLATLDVVSGKMNILIGSGTMGNVECGATTISTYEGINTFSSIYNMDSVKYQ